MHVEPAGRAVIGHLEHRPDPVRHQDLQIGDRDRRIAADPHIGQPGEMRDALFDRPVMLRVRRAAGDRRPPGRPGKLGAAVEHAVLGPHRGGILARAGIGARRVARDQIVDVEPVLDQAEPLVERLAAFAFGCH